jgi:hypothetical protein
LKSVKRKQNEIKENKTKKTDMKKMEGKKIIKEINQRIQNEIKK